MVAGYQTKQSSLTQDASKIIFEHGSVRFRMNYLEIGRAGAPVLRTFCRGKHRHVNERRAPFRLVVSPGKGEDAVVGYLEDDKGNPAVSVRKRTTKEKSFVSKHVSGQRPSKRTTHNSPRNGCNYTSAAPDALCRSSATVPTMFKRVWRRLAKIFASG